MSKSKLVLVTGATGKQGGAVVEALLDRGHRVRALTRNAAAPASNRLREHGVEIAVGDFSDHASMVRAARGADTVFAISKGNNLEQGAEKEVAQGLSQVTGREVHYEGFPPEVIRAQSEDLALMFEWFDRTGYTADIKSLRRDFPEVKWHTFEQWARQQDWSVLGQAQRS